jgi:hypothetical protein
MPKSHRFFALGLLLILLAGSFPKQARAQGILEITDQQVDYLFNSSLHFSAQYQSPEKMVDGYAFFQLHGADNPLVYKGELGPNQTLDVQVALDAANAPKAFSTVTYWFRLASDHGDFFDSPRYSFYYDDNRYIWQQLESAPFTLRWHNGDQAFANAILAASQQGVQRAGAMLLLPAAEAMTFQVYDSVQDVQLVAQLAGYSWVAGHTDPAANLILFSLEPGDQQSLEIQRQVPHEVAHLLFYQALGMQGYANLPLWLNEGFASNVEVYSDPLRAELLDLAHETTTLLPLFSLCKAFPQDTASARLAYAESASFVHYLFKRFNQTGFGLLVNAYAEGGDCENAPLASFGKNLDSLESEWLQATFAPANELQAELESLPWQQIIVAAGVALVLWALVRRLSRARN